LFSLGALLYELVTGRHPFRGETPMDTLSAILKVRPPRAREVDSKVPRRLSDLLERLLAKEPGERPASAAVVLAELEAASRELARPEASPEEEAPRSIAVLPFADMSPGKDQDYFCEGIAEELINALAHVEGLRVAARTSAFRFKGRADDVR